MKGHGAYWLVVVAVVLGAALYTASLKPIPIHYRAEALEAFSAFLQEPHQPEEFSAEFCDRGMCISLREAPIIREAFSSPDPKGYLESRGFSCREAEGLLICLTPTTYPLPEGYERAEVKIELS